MLQFPVLAQSVRWLFIGVLSLPIIAGVAGVLLPAFGYFPALGETSFSLRVFAGLWQVEGIGWMAWLSFLTGIAATALASLLAVALLAAFYQHSWLQILQRLLSPLLVLPHAAAAIALLFILAPSGWAARIGAQITGDGLPPQWALPYDQYGIAVILALALKELPFIFLMALSVLTQPQLQVRLHRHIHCAQAMGYAPVTAFIKVALPVIYPHLRLPILAVLAYATANVEIPLLLGPNNPPTLAVAVLQWFNHVDLSMRFQGSAAAVLQLLVTLTALASWWAAEQLLARWAQHMRLNGQRKQLSNRVRVVAWAGSLLFIMAGLLMLTSMLVWSVATYWPFPALLPEGVTLLHWQTALPALASPLVTTLVLGIAVSLLAVTVALLALEAETGFLATRSARWRQWDRAVVTLTLYLPLLVPGVAFLFGLVWFQQRWFAGSVVTSVFVSHLIYVLPYVFISLAVAYRRLDPRYVKVAAGLGQSPWQIFWRLKLPMLFGPILVAMALGMAISFSQYLPTLLSGGGSISTVTTEAVAVASGSSQRLSAVYVLVQVLLPLSGFFLAWWLPGRFFNPAARMKRRQQRIPANDVGA